jgi:hypothetical protein
MPFQCFPLLHLPEEHQEMAALREVHNHRKQNCRNANGSADPRQHAFEKIAHRQPAPRKNCRAGEICSRHRDRPAPHRIDDRRFRLGWRNDRNSRQNCGEVRAE